MVISESYEDYRNFSKGDGVEDIVNDNYFLWFFRVVVFDILVEISLGKLDEC